MGDQKNKKVSVNNRIALFVNGKVGTMQFFYFCVLLTLTPLIFPSLLQIVQFISSGVLQLVLLPLIMIATNIAEEKADKREQKDLETNIKAEKEIEKLQLAISRIETEKLDAIMKTLEELKYSVNTKETIVKPEQK